MVIAVGKNKINKKRGLKKRPFQKKMPRKKGS